MTGNATRDVPIAIAAGVASALCHMAASWGIVGALALALVVPLPLFAAGLSGGLMSAAIAAVAGTVVVGVAGDAVRAGIFLAADALPVLLIVRFALLSRTTDNGRGDGSVEWYPPGLLLAWLGLYCAGAFVAVAAVLGAGLEARINEYLAVFREMLSEGREAQAQGAVDAMFATFARVFPFVVVTWWIILLAANAALAQKILVRMGRNLRPSPDFRAAMLPPWLLPVVVAAAAVALLTSGWLGFVATNLALILCVPYFLAGLAVLHAISVRWPGRTAILIASYLLLGVFGWPVLLVTGLGMVEHWAGLRQRLGFQPKDGPGQGNERNE